MAKKDISKKGGMPKGDAIPQHKKLAMGMDIGLGNKSVGKKTPA